MTDGLTASDVAVLTGNNRNNDGFGDGNGWWIILFLLICGWGGYGNGWGGNGGANSPAFQGYATRADIDAALSTQGIESGIQNISTQLCNGFNTLGSQMANCCCDLKQGQGEINYNLAMQTNALQNTMNQNTNVIQSQLCNGFRDVIDAQNAGTQRIVDLFVNDKIQGLQTELQSAQLQLANAAQTNNIINSLRPTPVPAYPVMSPYASLANLTGFSFGNGYNCGNCAC